MLKLGAIGCGNMATAILRGVSAGMAGNCILSGFDVQPGKVESLAEFGVKPCRSAGEVLRGADYVLLAVKPQNIDDLLASLASDPNRDRVYLCIAAGITAEHVKKGLGFDARVVPIMPNTPLLIGKGATAMAKVPPVSESEFETARQIFSCAGIVRSVAADRMNEVIAVNGSTPAFLYEFARCFVEYGAGHGIGYADALALFCQTMRGAADMMEHSGRDIASLIDMVSSKGGTTIAGLNALREKGLVEAAEACCTACVKRAYELAEGK